MPLFKTEEDQITPVTRMKALGEDRPVENGLSGPADPDGDRRDDQDRSRGPKSVDIDIDEIPLDDKKTFELLGSAQTMGVFQLESFGHARPSEENSSPSFSRI